MSKKYVLISGAAGEVGHGLINALSADDSLGIVALDLKEINFPVKNSNYVSISGDITNRDLITDIFAKYEFSKVFHLAAVLSSGGERNPEKTHHINVDGSFNLISAAKHQSSRFGEPITFVFPSTIACYGIPTREEKMRAGAIQEDQYQSPITMYGINKLYVEDLGRYYSRFYRLLDENTNDVKLGFRALRFPGIMSSETMPTGGTSDYGSEMIHYSAQGKPYKCFVSPSATIPFMAMPDAIRSMLELAAAPKKNLSRNVYNVNAFSISAENICGIVKKHFPKAEISYAPHPIRERIVDSWPAELNDSAARTDWNWKAEYGQEMAFGEYLIPGIRAKYSV